ncbi:HEAT repeat domain-containing protein [Methanoplanus sp. FWC-SCC4]|uniref:HEAT repeat domain-containing protein n=1 Tax=Methanochimaera problematica TaxID=2609417 RepID=A0AA97FBI2_9EURY|nr:HEAT repeat domain-containing protein [Methanoplanus sp. FWC-SCC4]WOF15213.1 HEAT repeat domain-containing protein [Methanoplanus sp. FWC-SCC4]
MMMKSKGAVIIAVCLFFAAILVSGCTQAGNSESQTDALVNSLFSEDTDKIKESVEKLIETGEPAVEPLTKVFEKGDREASMWAAVALCKIGEPAIEPVVKLLRNSNEEVREWAGNTLACIGKDAVPALIEEVKTGTPNSKEAASITIIKIGEPALPFLGVELNAGDAKSAPEIDAIIRSIYATKGLLERLDTENTPAKNESKATGDNESGTA